MAGKQMLHQALSSSAGHFVAAPACIVCWEQTNMLLQTPVAQELLPGGELSEQSWRF
jgi:hypothetical protein